jgi:hypothetical protein
VPVILAPKIRRPDPDRALNQVLRRRAAQYKAEHSEGAPLVAGITVTEAGADMSAFFRLLNIGLGGPVRVSLLKPFPVDRTRCETCGLLDDDCRCTGNQA